MPKSLQKYAVLAAGAVVALLTITSARAQTHTVVAGDTLSAIADLYNVTVGEIVRVNLIPNPDLIFPGQTLDIPGPGSVGQPPKTYEVQDGDTLIGIAAKYGVSADELQRANGVDDPHFLRVGQQLAIPGQPAPTPAPAPVIEKPNDPELDAIFDDISAQEGIDPNLVKALAFVESGWQQGVVSSTGAVGVMQLMPPTAAWLERDFFGFELNEDSSAYDNIRMGCRLLHFLLDATHGNVELALASYYQGHTPTSNGVIYDDTRQYVATILAIKGRFWPG